jgi:hypothetical protein
MSEKCKNALSLILALAALATSALTSALPAVDSLPLSDSVYETLDKIWEEPINLALWGWLPQLTLIIISFLVSRRLKSRPLKIVTWLILAVSTISALIWATFAVMVLITDVLGF